MVFANGCSVYCALPGSFCMIFSVLKAESAWSLFLSRGVCGFHNLHSPYELSKSNFFAYLQLRHFIVTQICVYLLLCLRLF